jgi:hypothetical protein
VQIIITTRARNRFIDFFSNQLPLLYNDWHQSAARIK